MTTQKPCIFFLILLIAMTMGAPTSHAEEETVRELQSSIQETQREIEALDAEIREYQQEVYRLGNEKQTLKGAINEIDVTRKRLDADIQKTEKNIELTEAKITTLENSISEYSTHINTHREALRESLQKMRHVGELSVFEVLFLKDDHDVRSWDLFHQFIQLERSLRKDIAYLSQANVILAETIEAETDERHSLREYRGQVAAQKEIADDQRSAQQNLFDETANKESRYRQIVAEKEALRDEFFAELSEYESQLAFILDPSSLPAPGSGPLGFPVADVYVTQRFGITSASKRLYASGSHSGIDFRSAVGTPIYAAADGIVKGVGDTDLTCYRASFGKWVFIEHEMGLSTAYGHLSKIVAREGQYIQQGDILGYSGNTGHSTGPHLHMTVYATRGADGEGARVADRPSKACPGATYRIPLAPTEAYLDPELYLPVIRSNQYKPGA